MKFFYIICLLVISSILTSCNGEFLERHPTDRPVSEAFWNTKEDINMALIGCYSRLYLEPFGTRFRFEVLTDNARSFPQLDQEFNLITEGLINPNIGGPVSSWYNNMYRGVSSCNFFLDNIDRVDVIEAELKNQYIAEVKLLRAWFYFLLEQTYGGVILYNGVPAIENAKINKSTSDEVIEFILKDIDEAIPFLPDDIYSGRIVKNTAHAFKTKVLLHKERWEEAATEASKVIASGLCSLYPDYRKLFLSDAQTENPTEILFSTVYALPERWHRGGNDHLVYQTTNPRKELVEAYLCEDGLSTDQSPLFNPSEPYENRDPRFLKTINPTLKREVNGTEFIYTSETGFKWNKFIEDDKSYYDRNVEIDDYDIIHLRYADVLLMYAEAKNEASGPEESIYNVLDQIRTRANMPNVPRELDKNELREVIRLERRIELAGEGHRWFDIKRWGIANEALMEVDEPGRGIGTLKMLPHQYIWPIHQGEIDINENLEQNPEY